MNSSDISVHSNGEYVGIRMLPTQSSTPTPYHIALLIDTSGSMNQHGRLTTVKHTLDLLVDHLRTNDRLTLVSYNHTAAVVCHNESDKEKIKACIAGLKAGGGTNMEAAFLSLREYKVDSVFVLTDGEVNQGISSVVGLRSLAVTCFPRTAIHTLGYGADHNAELLRAISTVSRASYTYAEADEMIPEVVGTIVGGLQDEVAKDVEVLWEGEARCLEVGAEENRYWVGSVIAQKEQWIVFEGQPTNMRMRGGGEDMLVAEPISGNTLVPQVFRTLSVALFERIRENPRPWYEADLDDLEARIVCENTTDPMVLHIQAEIAEMREFLRRPQANNLTRLISNMQQLSVQRGVQFASPTQRIISTQMVDQFSQDPN